MSSVSMRESASKCALIIGFALAAAPAFWTAPARTDNASVTGYQGYLINRPGCWSENGYDGQLPCPVVPGGPGL